MQEMFFSKSDKAWTNLQRFGMITTTLSLKRPSSPTCMTWYATTHY